MKKRTKNPNAVALGRLGGRVKTKKGFAVVPKEKRSEAGKKGAQSRWRKYKQKGEERNGKSKKS